MSQSALFDDAAAFASDPAAELVRLRDRERKLETNIKALAGHIAEATRPCLRCKAEIHFIRHKNGKLTPYDPDLTNHFITCKFADEFRKKEPA